MRRRRAPSHSTFGASEYAIPNDARIREIVHALVALTRGCRMATPQERSAQARGRIRQLLEQAEIYRALREDYRRRGIAEGAARNRQNINRIYWEVRRLCAQHKLPMPDIDRQRA